MKLSTSLAVARHVLEARRCIRHAAAAPFGPILRGSMLARARVTSAPLRCRVPASSRPARVQHEEGAAGWLEAGDVECLG